MMDAMNNENKRTELEIQRDINRLMEARMKVLDDLCDIYRKSLAEYEQQKSSKETNGIYLQGILFGIAIALPIVCFVMLFLRG